MSLKLYLHPMSQPARALMIFLNKTKIPFTPKFVDLLKGENKTPEFKAINPLQKVPVIQDGDFILKESVAIFQYLTSKYKVDDHWYPRDLEKRARVDEYMSWQQHNTRLMATMVFRTQFINSYIMGKPVDVERLKEYQDGLEQVLDDIELVYLKDGRKYLLGEELTVADLLGVCELMQPIAVGRDVTDDRPSIKRWMDNVKSETQPHFDEAHKTLHKAKDIYLASKM